MTMKNYNQFITESRSKLDFSMITLNFEEAYDLIIGGNLQIIEIQPRLLILHGVTTPAGSFRICYKNSTRQKCDCIRVPFENEQEKEKILKTFKKEDNSKFLQNIEDICLDLKSEYFEIKIVDRTYRNDGCIYVGLLKDPSGELSVEFKLHEVIETIQQIVDYMNSEGFVLEAVHEFDFERITNLPKDNIESWNKNQEVVGLDLFFN